MRTIETWRGNILLETIHGSRLYGLDHEDSDEDYYVVTEHGPAKQKVTTEDGKTTDFFVIGLDSFLEKVEKGTHQAVEALHSREASYKPGWKEYFQGMRTYSPLIEETYDRTIRHLAFGDTHKKRRHAVRLMFNLIDLRMYGKFDPRLTEVQQTTATYMASLLDSESLLESIQHHLLLNRVRPERNTNE